MTPISGRRKLGQREGDRAGQAATWQVLQSVARLLPEPGFHSLWSSEVWSMGLFHFFLGWGGGVGSDCGDTEVP